MFCKNLKYYRLKNNLSKKDLAERIGVTSMAITNYENGDRRPDMEIMKSLAAALNVRIADFLVVRDRDLTFVHGEFRKNANLPATARDFVREAVEEYLNRFMSVVEILGGEVLPDAPMLHALELLPDIEQDARNLRSHLALAPEGPIGNLVNAVENKGILLIELPIENKKFSGMNGRVNEHPYIVVNSGMSTERKRSTILHELAHLMFRWDDAMDENTIENVATAIGGAVLFSKNDVIRELGVRRSFVSRDMEWVAKEYGISMLLLITRAKLCGVITEQTAKNYSINASVKGWRTNEPSRIEAEPPHLFEQLVFRAVNEGEISVQRGAELLKISYDEVIGECGFHEESEWNI